MDVRIGKVFEGDSSPNGVVNGWGYVCKCVGMAWLLVIIYDLVNYEQ